MQRCHLAEQKHRARCSICDCPCYHSPLAASLCLCLSLGRLRSRHARFGFAASCFLRLTYSFAAEDFGFRRLSLCLWCFDSAFLVCLFCQSVEVARSAHRLLSCIEALEVCLSSGLSFWGKLLSLEVRYEFGSASGASTCLSSGTFRF